MTDEILSIRRGGRRMTLLGLAIVGGLVAGTATWAMLAAIEGAVVGDGALTIDGNIKAVQHRTGGIVAEILTAEGAEVTAGQVLVRLDDTTARGALGVIDVKSGGLAIRLARLRAEIAGAAEFSVPSEAAERLDPVDFRSAVASERALFEARQREVEGQRRQAREQVRQLQNQVESLTAERESNRAQMALVSDELVPLQQLYERGLTTRSAIFSLRRSSASAEGNINRIEADTAAATSAIAEAGQRLEQIDRDLRSRIATEIRDAEADRSELAERRRDALAQFAATAIKAPVGGTVQHLDIHTVGGVVAPGQTMMTIVPADARLATELKIPPTDIDQMRIGAPVHVRIRAGNQRLAPVLEGRVSGIDRDISRDERSGLSFYRIRVDLTAAAGSEIGGLRAVAGMPVQGFIVTESRSPIAYLLAPLVEQMTHAWRER